MKKIWVLSLVTLSLLGFIGMSFEASTSSQITNQSASTNSFGEGW
ncbi:hypothetical protein ACLMAB_14225 [Brevibacillus laterosporus]